MKRCRLCKKIKKLIHFGKQTQSLDGKQSYCKKCSAQKSYARARTIEGKFAIAMLKAKVRKLKWELTFEEYVSFRQQNCYYCNGSLPETGVGLDRIDSKKHYKADNVVPCCTTCNRLFSNFNKDYVYAHMQKMLDVRAKKLLSR